MRNASAHRDSSVRRDSAMRRARIAIVAVAGILGSFAVSNGQMTQNENAAPTPSVIPPTHWAFSFGSASLPGFTPVDIAARFGEQNPVGFDNGGGAYPVGAGDHVTAAAPFYFSVKVPEGSYRVVVHLGGDADGTTTVKGELRRLMLEKIHTEAGQQVTREFAVSVRQPPILGQGGKVIAQTRVKGREAGRGGALNRTPGGKG